MKLNPFDALDVFETPNARVTPLATRHLGSEQVSVIHQKMDSGCSNPAPPLSLPHR